MAVAYELVARFDGHNRIFGAKMSRWQWRASNQLAS
jgi:hypothetical protein